MKINSYRIIPTEGWGWSSPMIGQIELDLMLQMCSFDIGDRIVEIGGPYVYQVIPDGEKQKLVKIGLKRDLLKGDRMK